MGEQGGRSAAGWKVLFWLYLLFLLVFVVVKFNGSARNLLERIQIYGDSRASGAGYDLNLKPFATIRTQLRFWPAGWAVKNLAGNLLAFVPFGYLLPLAHRRLRHAFLVLPISLAFACAIEAFQYVTLLGACDVDDVILNVLGCMMGYFVFSVFQRR